MPAKWLETAQQPPAIAETDSFPTVVEKLAPYFIEAIQAPHSFEELRVQPHVAPLTPLIHYVSQDCRNIYIVHALLALKSHFAAVENDDQKVNEARGLACEAVAWQFVRRLSWLECIQYLLIELPQLHRRGSQAQGPVDRHDRSNGRPQADDVQDERTPLMSRSTGSLRTPDASADVEFFAASASLPVATDPSGNDDFTSSFSNLNALEVAAVSESKNFLSQRVIQRMIDCIWRGEIIFWESLSPHSVKGAKIYDKQRADPFSRLRVPRYIKAFEVVFFASFLLLYYVVLVQKNFHAITPAEVLLYLWITSFAINEVAEYQDAGRMLYAADFWSLWDLAIVGCGFGFFLTRITGLISRNDQLIDTAFDILALEALFLVPRICSLLSLNSYFGILLPSLKEMTKEFIKFLSLVVILYLGFLTTFTLLARGHFTARQMSGILVRVFFGSSYLGFDVAEEISPLLGPPVMLVFIILTNILLITSLISLLSNTLDKILDHARLEYTYTFSLYVLEASTSNRLVYYFPPLNLIPILLFRPLRLFISSERLRGYRIWGLRVTHLPHVLAIWLFESVSGVAHTVTRANTGRPERSASLKRLAFKSSSNPPRQLSRAALAQPAAAFESNSSNNDGQPADADDDGSGAIQNGSPSAQGLSDDLRDLLFRLSAQVDQLTAVVAQQQQMPVPATRQLSP